MKTGGTGRALPSDGLLPADSALNPPVASLLQIRDGVRVRGALQGGGLRQHVSAGARLHHALHVRRQDRTHGGTYSHAGGTGVGLTELQLSSESEFSQRGTFPGLCCISAILPENSGISIRMRRDHVYMYPSPCCCSGGRDVSDPQLVCLHVQLRGRHDGARANLGGLFHPETTCVSRAGRGAGRGAGRSGRGRERGGVGGARSRVGGAGWVGLARLGRRTQ